MVSVVLFDLDGTLTDPAVGITASYRHALTEVGVSVADDEDLTWAIGPPVRDNFEAYGLAADLVEPAINAFRERHTAVGLFEAVVLPGIEDLLDDLRSRHVRIGLATAKPRPQALLTLEHFGLASRFDAVAGSRADVHSMPKSEIVADALAQLGQYRSVARPSCNSSSSSLGRSTTSTSCDSTRSSTCTRSGRRR